LEPIWISPVRSKWECSPAAPLDRFQQVGNAAGVGAKEMLLSKQKRDESLGMIGRVQYVELTIYPDFTQRFVDAMYF
jgi:uncharacterized 2Fe-2S/4Fe-4S cluster protein (DUF4445 family)